MAAGSPSGSCGGAIEHLLPAPDPLLYGVWKAFAPSNVKAFTWRLLLDRLATLDNLLRRRVIVSLGDASCKLCHNHMETSFHLLFSCAFSQQVWQRCFSWLGMVAFSSTSPRDHLLAFRLGHNSLQLRVARAIWMSIVWSLWLARNELIFRDDPVDVGTIIELVQCRSWHWIKVNVAGFPYSFAAWSLSPLNCIIGL
ncbi:uncharacterized protein LOC130736881 [Lotus japonicus]|uniref:uncharacterized protein LOC130736881 n=1 Tax=Lotus japonicus TaxID=34305 RepID=UPI00258A9FD3|nr:uncharacterized protein LOC130736881 [Lotus japonicus]